MIIKTSIAAVCLFVACSASTTPTPTTTTDVKQAAGNDSQQGIPLGLNVWDSAFFRCGDIIFQNDSITILFPPSDASMPNVTNITEAELSFSDTYKTFCGKLPSYIQCVKEIIRDFPTYVDTKITTYIDMDSIDSAFDMYCHNNDSIPSQLGCTLQAVESYSCPYGGIFGTLEHVLITIQNGLVKEEYCRVLNESIRCRVDNQLKKCNPSYAATMEFVYHALTDKYCLL